jgi:predicted glycosyltransferase involved in capsule biosynthesis
VILEYLKRKHTEYEIIVVVMEKDIDLKKLTWVRKKFVAAPFESARANNIGASMATTNIFFFQDADILFRVAYYDMIVKRMMTESYESARIGEQCVNMSRDHVMKIRINAKYVDDLVSKQYQTCLRDAPGACIAMTRDAFVRVGGHCELFKCYGWEDCYMRVKVRRLTKQFSLGKQTLHLAHETNYQMGQQAVNAPLYQALLGKDFDKCVQRDRKFLIGHYPVFAK